MLDISAYKSKLRARAVVEENMSSAAGTAGTRREPVQFTDRQLRIVERFTQLVSWQRRRAFLAEVEARLSGPVGDGAVFAACRGAADGFISVDVLVEHDLVQHKDYEKKWRSKAVLGTGR